MLSSEDGHSVPMGVVVGERWWHCCIVPTPMRMSCLSLDVEWFLACGCIHSLEIAFVDLLCWSCQSSSIYNAERQSFVTTNGPDGTGDSLGGGKEGAVCGTALGTVWGGACGTLSGLLWASTFKAMLFISFFSVTKPIPPPELQGSPI